VTESGAAKRTEMTSFRLPGDVVAALRVLAEENGETLTDVLRKGALMVLGKCPTCGRDVEG
jgi:hypothetical protein